MKSKLLLGSLLPLSLIFGQSWNVDASGDWGVAGNWAPATVPNAVDATATFAFILTAPRTISLTTVSPTVGTIIVNSQVVTNSYTIAGAGANVLTMSVSTGSAAITNAGFVEAVISAPITLTSNVIVTLSAVPASNLTLSGGVSGGGSMTVVSPGGGHLLLSAGNTFTGGLTIGTGTVAATVDCMAVSVLPPTGSVAIGTFGVSALNLNGFAQTIGGLSGAGFVNLAGGALTITTTGANSYGGSFTGAGSLIVGGTGSLTLTNTSPFASFATTVNGGSLILGVNNALPIGTALTVTSPGIFNLDNFNQQVASLAGNGSVTLGSGTLTSSGNTSTSFSGVISGTGGLTQNGTVVGSTLTLSGANNYTGTTTIQGGVLQLGASGALPSGTPMSMTGGTFDLNNFSQTVGTFTATTGSVTLGSGVLTVVPTANASFGAVISETGSVVYQGPNTWTYAASQTYTGGTTVNGGTLLMGVANGFVGPLVLNTPGILSMNNNPLALASLAGDGTVSMGSGNLTLNTTTSTTFSGSIGGTGALVVQGTGTQILTGTNNYSGGTTVAGTATLQGTTTALQGAIVNNSILYFNQTFDGTYTGPLSGTGQLQIGGGGVVTLSGTPTQTSATVLGGTLSLAPGAILTASPVTVNSGGTLGGNGTVVGNVLNAGAIGPGASVGILTVNGNVTFQPGSSYIVELTPTSADLLIVNGVMTIQAGSEITIAAERGDYEEATRYTVVTSTSPVVGQFSSFIQTNPFLTFDIFYNQLLPGSVEVELIIRSLSDVIQGGNAGAIAKCITQTNMMNDEDLESLVSEIIFFPVDEVRKILETMQPSQLRALTVAEQNNSLFAQSILNDRMDAFDRSRCEKEIDKHFKWNVWASLAGNWTDQRKADHNVGYTAPAGALMIGADGRIAQNLYMGVAAEYSYVALHWRENQGSSNINRMSAGPYLSYTGGRGYVNASILASFASFDAKRHIPFFDRTAKSQHFGETLLPHLDAGVIFHPASHVSLTPFAAVDLLYGWEDSFEESGAESLNFKIDSSTSKMFRSEVGLKISKCAVRSHGKWVHDLKASWVREDRFHGKDLTATFRQFPCSFTVEGLYPTRNLLDLGMGLTFIFKHDKMSASLRYEGQFGEAISIQSGVAQFLCRF